MIHDLLGENVRNPDIHDLLGGGTYDKATKKQISRIVAKYVAAT